MNVKIGDRRNGEKEWMEGKSERERERERERESCSTTFNEIFSSL